MKKTILWAFALAVLLTACGSSPKEYIPEQEESTFAEINESSADSSLAVIAVYVCGAVEAPGVVGLSEGARVTDAIAAAGGLSANADTRLLNLARRLSDGEQITVLTKEEAESLLGDDPAKRTKKLLGEDVNTASDGRINLNLADEETLKTLPGIGEAKAAAIVRYRDANGAFAKVEDVCSVPGIKGSVFEKIKDRITV